MNRSWDELQMAIREQVAADPELARLKARYLDLTNGRAGSLAHQRAERAYLDRLRVVQAQAQQDQTLTAVDREREDKAAYMRDYRAGKRAEREAADRQRQEAR